MLPETPRVPVDLAWAEELKVFLHAQLAEAPAPNSIEGQVQGVFLAGYCRDLALVRYAEGGPIDEVRALLRRSSEFHFEVFKLRGIDHTAPVADRAAQSDDRSLTNSRRGLQAMEVALACGALDLARALAPWIWDAPDASYLGPGSVVCTPEEQHLAYALRDLLLDRFEEGLREIHALPALPPEQEDRATILTALLKADPPVFAWALGELHTFHLDQVGHPGTLDTLEDLLDIPTLAYAVLGRNRLPDLNPLPSDAFLPLELPFPQLHEALNR